MDPPYLIPVPFGSRNVTQFQLQNLIEIELNDQMHLVIGQDCGTAIALKNK
jgi:hypothetical protein